MGLLYVFPDTLVIPAKYSHVDIIICPLVIELLLLLGHVMKDIDVILSF